MFSPINNVFVRYGHYAFYKLKEAISKLTHHIISQYFIPQKNDGVNVSGISIIKKIVLINPSKMPQETARELLTYLMPAHDKDARRSYNFVSFFTGGQSFLSLQDDMALPIRKRIVAGLHAMQGNINFAIEMQTLITQLKNNNINSNNKNPKKIIEDHLLDLFTRALLGVKFPEELKKVLVGLEKTHYPDLFAFLPIWASQLLPLIPSVRNLRNHTNNEIKVFLMAQIESIKQDYLTNGKIKKNWLVNILLEKVPDIRFISKQEISALADDPEVRICVAIVLSTSNLTRVMMSLIYLLFENPQLISRLILEIKTSSPDEILDKAKMPLLHATYLESLRLGVKLSIVRNINSSIQLGNIYIPQNALVIFPLDANERMENHQYPASDFKPERFLNRNGELCKDMNLHEGLFVPFGLGIRMCPGRHIAEQILKIYLVTLLTSVKSLSPQKTNFYDEKETARSLAVNLLKTEIGLSISIPNNYFSFFRPSKKIKQESINNLEKIMGNIAEYCL